MIREKDSLNFVKKKKMDSYIGTKIVNFIQSYFDKYITENFAIWDYYILNYEVDEFVTLTVYCHTWEGNGIVKEYIQRVIKIPYIDIIQ